MGRKWYLSGSVTNDPDFRDKFAYAEFQLSLCLLQDVARADCVSGDR